MGSIPPSEQFDTNPHWITTDEEGRLVATRYQNDPSVKPGAPPKVLVGYRVYVHPKFAQAIEDAKRDGVYVSIVFNGEQAVSVSLTQILIDSGIGEKKTDVNPNP